MACNRQSKVISKYHTVLNHHGLKVMQPLMVAHHVQGGTSVKVPYISLIHHRVGGVASDESSVLEVVNNWGIITFSGEVGPVNIM